MFKTLQSLVESLDSEKISMGAIIAENETRELRHLRHCASERKIPLMVVTPPFLIPYFVEIIESLDQLEITRGFQGAPNLFFMSLNMLKCYGFPHNFIFNWKLVTFAAS